MAMFPMTLCNPYPPNLPPIFAFFVAFDIFVVRQCRDFKFGTQVGVASPSIWTTNHPTLNFGAPSISQEWLKLELSNFVHRWAISSHPRRMNYCPQNGRGYGHVTYLNC